MEVDEGSDCYEKYTLCVCVGGGYIKILGKLKINSTKITINFKLQKKKTIFTHSILFSVENISCDSFHR